LYHLSQGKNLPPQLLNIIFVRMMLLVIILFDVSRKICSWSGFTPLLHPLFHSDLTHCSMIMN